MLAIAAVVLLLGGLLLLVILAIEYLPWWAALLFIALLFGAIFFGVPYMLKRLGRNLLTRAGVGLFSVKGRVLKDAKVRVLSVRKLSVEEGIVSKQAPGGKHEPADQYAIHITITPKFGQGPFQLYDPHEIMLLPFHHKMKWKDLEDDTVKTGAELEDVKILRSGDPPENAPPEVVQALAERRSEMQRAKRTADAQADDENAGLLDEGEHSQLDLELDSIVSQPDSAEETIDIQEAEAKVAEQMSGEPAEARRVGEGPDDDDAFNEMYQEDFGGECFGQSELLMTWSVPRSHARRVKLWYYFHEFGDIKLPN